MADIFDAYALADAWDEMFERPGEVRTAYEPVLAALQPMEPAELRFRADQMARSFTDRGVTYAFAGQDIAHLTAGLLRSLGLPTRYVSGYLHPERDAELHRPVEGQSHAWVEYWAGDWTGYDPTNRTRANESHVVVGRGRDYDDVTPHKGVYRGVAGGPPEVTVEFTRVA